MWAWKLTRGCSVRPSRSFRLTSHTSTTLSSRFKPSHLFLKQPGFFYSVVLQINHFIQSGNVAAGFCFQGCQMMVPSSQTHQSLHRKSRTAPAWKTSGGCVHTQPLCHLVFHIDRKSSRSFFAMLQRCRGELLLSAAPSAPPSTLPPALHSVSAAGGAGGRSVLGANPASEQTA